MRWHHRQDRAVTTLSAAKETEEGYLHVDGFAVVPGVLRYPRPDGSVIRELILPEDIHDAAALESLKRKPITWEHPPSSVTAKNVDTYGVGDLDGQFERGPDGELAVKFVLRKSDCVERFKRGDKRGLSPGYMCQLDNTPGTHPVYGEYDRRQFNRRYNHLAIVENPRGGPRASARFDAEDFVLEEEVDPEQIKKIVVDALKEQADREQGRVDAATASALAPIAAELGVEADQAKIVEAIKANKARQDGAADADKLAYATERAPLLVVAAERKLDAAEVARLGNAELRKKCALAVLPSARQDAGEEYYRAILDVVATLPAEQVETIRQPEQAPAQKTDSKTEFLSPRQLLEKAKADARNHLSKE